MRLKPLKSVVCMACLVMYAVGCAPTGTVIPVSDPHIKYIGRIAQKNGAAELTWTASSININFKGTAVSALLNDSKGTDLITIVVDGKVLQTLQPEKATYKYYKLVSGLRDTVHQLQLFKRTEYQMGTLQFKGFRLSGKLLPPPAFKHRIEFYANSITCGYALEDPDGKDRGDYSYENGYLSYANLTARHFNAEYQCIAKSGIGVTVSWFPTIMPEIYDRVNALDSTTRWDFKKYSPEIVVINLFQNDYHLVNNVAHKEFKHRFGNTPPTPEFIVSRYREFVTKLRSKYPDAKIICALGSMDSNEPGSPFPGYITEAVKQMNDKNVSTLFFPYLGAHRHPNIKEHEKMAQQLISYVERKFGW